MKRIVMLMGVLLAFVFTAEAQMDRAFVSRNASYIDTVYTDVVKLALQNVGRRPFFLQVDNEGKCSGGSGYLYAGLVTITYSGMTQSVNYDTSTATSAWARAMRIYPGTTDMPFSWKIEDCVADSLFIWSTDSVKVTVYQW